MIHRFTNGGIIDRVVGSILIDESWPAPGFGVLIKNRSDDLTIEQVRISKWNGAGHSKERESGKSYLRLAGGALIVAEIRGLEAGMLSVSLRSPDPAAVLPVAPPAATLV